MVDFRRFCPEGTDDTSPTFQRWVSKFMIAQVPKGRLKCSHVVPVLLILLSLEKTISFVC
jgi:hypothetical protein